MVPLRRVRRLLGGAALAIVVLGVAAACTGAPAPSSPGVSVSGAWVRPAAIGGDTAAYFTISNAGPADALLSVQCGLAGSAMLHRTSTDSSGMTGMSMIEKVPVPAGSTVELEPGGTHVMMGGLTRALAAGDSVELRLTFERAGEIVVPAAVRAG